MAKVYTGERVFLSPIFAGPERFLYRILRVDAAASAGLEGVREKPDHLLARGLALPVLRPAHAERLLRAARAQPARLSLGAGERDLQHRLVVHDEHQLAVLRRRDDDDLPQPDDRADGPELAVGGCRASSWRSRSCAGSSGAAARASATSGRTSCARSCTCSRRCRCIGALVLASQGVIANFSNYLTVHTITGLNQTIAMGPVASQEAIKDARHQRRRLLQHQLRAPVREPDRSSPTSSRCCSC